MPHVGGAGLPVRTRQALLRLDLLPICGVLWCWDHILPQSLLCIGVGLHSGLQSDVRAWPPGMDRMMARGALRIPQSRQGADLLRRRRTLSKRRVILPAAVVGLSPGMTAMRLATGALRLTLGLHDVPHRVLSCATLMHQ